MRDAPPSADWCQRDTFRPEFPAAAAGQCAIPRPVSSQALMQWRHASAQIRQCPCISAYFSYSSAHNRHAAAQESSIWRIISSSDPVRRVAILPVMLQMSAQSRLSRMHWRRRYRSVTPRKSGLRKLP